MFRNFLENNNAEDLKTDGCMVLYWVVKKQIIRMWIGLKWLRIISLSMVWAMLGLPLLLLVGGWVCRSVSLTSLYLESFSGYELAVSSDHLLWLESADWTLYSDHICRSFTLNFTSTRLLWNHRINFQLSDLFIRDCWYVPILIVDVICYLSLNKSILGCQMSILNVLDCRIVNMTFAP